MSDIYRYEKIVKLKTEGSLLAKRIFLITIYALLIFVGIPMAIIYLKGNVPIVLTLVAITALFIFITWKQSCIEYEYTIISGMFYLARIRGKIRRKEVFEAELRDAVTIAPFNEEFCEKAEKCEPNDVFYAVSSHKSENAWFIIFEESGGAKTLIIFEADDKAISTLRHYCPRVTVGKFQTNKT